jgi:tetratricopeptide (TPR) repeat protein
MKTFCTFILIWIFTDHRPETLLICHSPNLVGTTASAGAKSDFEQGLLLLHNFEYPDARDLFREARRKDPSFALAYWGEAMTYNHPVWHSQNTAGAREVLERYEKIRKANTEALPPPEADLVSSLELLYGDGTKAERDKAYSDFMEELYEKYSGNHDVAAFYALSLLGLAEGWDKELCNRAAEISAQILHENPVHPGALHYYIHAEDHPEYAKLALDQANDYAKVASYSGHALHMPSHIYLALGLWDDVVRSNEVSWQAGVDRKKAKGLTNDALNYHSHWWLEYGYLQQGRFARAEQLLKDQLAFTRQLSSPSARTHFVIMRAHYLLETNDWQNPLAFEQVKVKDLRLEIRTLDRFVTGLIAFRDGDKNRLSELLAGIQADISRSEQNSVINEGMTQCNPVPFAQSGISRIAIRQATLLKEELSGLSALVNRDTVRARAYFKTAVEMEEQNGHFFGPPEIIKPTLEFYGEFLLAIGHPDLALSSFEEALRKTPGRNQSLLGLRAACMRVGECTKEKEISEILKNNLRNTGVSQIRFFFPVR